MISHRTWSVTGVACRGGCTGLGFIGEAGRVYLIIGEGMTLRHDGVFQRKRRKRSGGGLVDGVGEC